MQDFILSEPWFWVIPNWVQFVLIGVIGDLVGCFSGARFISRLKKRDITKIGSGNPGATNMIREFGFLLGALTFFIDAFKAGIPAVIVYHLYNQGGYTVANGAGGLAFTGAVFEGTQIPVGLFAALLCGVCAVLGHIYPITTGFKGGKGISSGLGLFWLTLGLANPWYLLIGAAVIITLPFTITLTKMGSLCNLSYLAGFGVWQIGMLYAFYGVESIWITLCAVFTLLAVAVSWAAHFKNIRCLLSGEEHPTVMIKFKKKVKKV